MTENELLKFSPETDRVSAKSGGFRRFRRLGLAGKGRGTLPGSFRSGPKAGGGVWRRRWLGEATGWRKVSGGGLGVPPEEREKLRV
ncbi:unnamed protein product [Prunus armeniaca]